MELLNFLLRICLVIEMDYLAFMIFLFSHLLQCSLQYRVILYFSLAFELTNAFDYC
jgi:hypothetical protein